MQWYDYLRIATAVLAVFAGYRLLQLMIKDYNTYTPRLAEFVWILFMVFFTLFAGAVEAILEHNGWRYGALLSFFIAAAGVRATRDGGALQRFQKPKDYNACGVSVMLGDKLVGYCDKEVVTKKNVRTHIDHRPLHHVSVLYDDDLKVAQE
jgi:hypothetical protein